MFKRISGYPFNGKFKHFAEYPERKSASGYPLPYCLSSEKWTKQLRYLHFEYGMCCGLSTELNYEFT